MIGKQWTTSAIDRARRRAVDRAEEDVLRLELETAFSHGVQVIPVLVEDAEMPTPSQLARPFRPVPGLQAVTLRNPSWVQDFDALLGAILEAARQPATEALPPTTGPDVTSVRL